MGAAWPLAAQSQTQTQTQTQVHVHVHVHALHTWTDLAQPWVRGCDSSNFVRDFWKYVDIDTAERRRRGGAAH